MKRIVWLVCFCLFVVSAYAAGVYANGRNTVNAVLLSFADYTHYDKKMMNKKIMEDKLLEELMYMPEFSIMEHFPVQEALDAEEKFNNPLGAVSKIVDKTDYEAAFEVPDNDIDSKKEGDVLSPAKTRMIGNKYNADYLVHGTINYMEKNSKETFIPLKNSSLTITNPYLETLVTVRIIKADTGKIVWRRQETAISKENLWEYKDAKRNGKVGSGKFNDTMFDKALQKASVKIAKALREDIDAKKVIL
ncbi:MAG: hypothetical protein IJR05_01425 [Acidaminococcaceae bacterium]|nr:hypothetical protein [Acidaminococcaceae bacterium]